MNDAEADLRRLAEAPPPAIAALLASEPDRLARLTYEAAGIYFDFSKLAVSAEIEARLLARAVEVDLPGWRQRLFSGGIVNISERRAATHMAERGTGADADVAAAAAGQAAMKSLVETLRSEAVEDIIHIGIGGSALGPALLLDALGRDDSGESRGPRCHVVANVDGEALARVLPRCNPARTRIVIASKTFTTTETMTNATSAMAWLESAGIAEPRRLAIAVTAAPARAIEWGVGAVLPFAATVGGRYSLWSTVGLPFALRCGWPAWTALHAGAAAMDAHFRNAPLARNVPVLAGLFDVWAGHYCRQPVRGVFAYDERLRLLAPFLQQLEMESNGKRVSRDGTPVAGLTAPVTWGGTGTDAQHAVFQLLHQGTIIGPIEFVAVHTPGHAMPATHHRQLLANCFAQGAALMQGRPFEAALALSGDDPALAAAKTFPGNRPSATILLDRLDPATLGALLAFYEHRTFVAGVLLGINSFDQWGVELGKEMASAALAGGESGFDASTLALMARGLAP